MKTFTYTITDALGIHARPAGLLAREAKGFPDTVITVAWNGLAARANQLMKLMSLGVKQGDTVTVTAQGGSEEAACAAMEAFFKAHL